MPVPRLGVAPLSTLSLRDVPHMPLRMHAWANDEHARASHPASLGARGSRYRHWVFGGPSASLEKCLCRPRPRIFSGTGVPRGLVSGDAKSLVEISILRGWGRVNGVR